MVQHAWWLVTGAAVLVAIGSGWADHRRLRRDDPDRVGYIDWRTVQITALAGAIIAASLAFNA